MVGSLNGSKEKVKMERSVTLVGIGKPESLEDGMDAQIYLVNLMENLSLLWMHLDFKVQVILIVKFFSVILFSCRNIYCVDKTF